MRMNIDTVWTLEVREKDKFDFVTLAVFSARKRALEAQKVRQAAVPEDENAVFRYKLDERISYQRVI